MSEKPNYLPAAAVLALGFLLAAKVTFPPVTQGRTQIQTLRADVAALQADVDTRPAETSRNVRLQTEFDALKDNLPDDEDLPEVLATLRRAAQALNINAPSLSRTVRASEVPGVAAVDLEMKIEGTYARTQALVQTVARLPRAYTLRGINLSAQGPNGEVGGTLRLTTYKREALPPTPPAQVSGGMPTAVPGPGGTP